jgi:hypothetical protein
LQFFFQSEINAFLSSFSSSWNVVLGGFLIQKKYVKIFLQEKLAGGCMKSFYATVAAPYLKKFALRKAKKVITK